MNRSIFRTDSSTFEHTLDPQVLQQAILETLCPIPDNMVDTDKTWKRLNNLDLDEMTEPKLKLELDCAKDRLRREPPGWKRDWLRDRRIPAIRTVLQKVVTARG